MFLQQLRLKSINEEFLDILKYIPEGVMIAQINVDARIQDDKMGLGQTFSKDIVQFLLNIKKTHQVDVRFQNKSMREFT